MLGLAILSFIQETCFPDQRMGNLGVWSRSQVSGLGRSKFLIIFCQEDDDLNLWGPASGNDCNELMGILVPKASPKEPYLFLPSFVTPESTSLLLGRWSRQV